MTRILELFVTVYEQRDARILVGYRKLRGTRALAGLACLSPALVAALGQSQSVMARADAGLQKSRTPTGCPCLHGFVVLDDVRVDGFTLGKITEPLPAG